MQSALLPKLDSPRLLLVEGTDDEHVVGHLWKRVYGSDPPFFIGKREGVGNLLRSIRDEANAPGREILGIVVDANDDVSGRWQAVTDRLQSAGIVVPAERDPAGTVIEGKPHEGAPRVGIWLMPDNVATGELEDFVAEMVPSNDPVWPMSEGYIGGIPCTHRKFPEGKTLRAQIYAWLAVREDPRQIGLAIKAKDLDVDDAHCKRFVGWLERLFA